MVGRVGVVVVVVVMMIRILGGMLLDRFCGWFGGSPNRCCYCYCCRFGWIVEEDYWMSSHPDQTIFDSSEAEEYSKEPYDSPSNDSSEDGYYYYHHHSQQESSS